jgi:hypothetical protein
MHTYKDLREALNRLNITQHDGTYAGKRVRRHHSRKLCRPSPENVNDSMKEFCDEEWLHFTLNVGDEEHAIPLHMNQIVLWRDQYGAHLLGMR